MKFWTSLIAGAAMALTAATAGAQAWPARPIKIIVPFPPGTVTDTTTRIVAPALSAALGQQKWPRKSEQRDKWKLRA